MVSPLAVGIYFSSEQAAGHMLGPVLHSKGIHTRAIDLVLKGHRGDAWRRIIHLSHPSGPSVDDFIPSELCFLRYPSVDDAVDFVWELGQYTYLTKVDLRNAYPSLPV